MKKVLKVLIWSAGILVVLFFIFMVLTTLFSRHLINETVKEPLKLAEQGDAAAQMELCRIYEKFYNYSESTKWCRKALEQGNAEAQLREGNSEQSKHNYPEAIKWYTKSAEQGYAPAQNNLGVMYYEGKGVEQNYTEALKWLTKAAEQGYREAQNFLGLMYVQGKGVEQNYVEAYKYFTLAAADGHERTSAVMRDKVTKVLTQSQLIEAQRLAKEEDERIKARTGNRK